MKIITDTIDQLFKGTGDFFSGGIDSLFDTNPKLLQAKFGNTRDLFSNRYAGFSLGQKSMTTLQSRNNCLLFAPSGVGKTTTCLIPTAIKIALSKEGNSMVINNPSGELTQLQNFLISQGYTVLKFDPNDPEHSIHYNPLSRIRTDADIQKVAKMIVSGANKDAKDFWAIKAQELIALLIDFLLAHTPKVNQNLANVFALLQHLAGNEKAVNGLFADRATEDQWRTYKSIVSNSDNTMASIISSAIASLSFIGSDTTLRNLTSVDTFDVAGMRTEKVVLFLNCPLSDASYYEVLMGLFFEQLFAEVFEGLPRGNDKDIFLLIDELSSIPMPNLANVIANARKFRLPILGVLQSENQLYEKYGQYNAKTIINNATRIYMTGLSDEAERLEKALGTYQYYADKEKKVLRSRPLMPADEIRVMPRGRVIVLPNGGMRPLYVKVQPFYKIRRYKRFMEMELPEGFIPQAGFTYQAQYLSLDKYNSDE